MYKTPKPENVVEQRDAIEIVSAEKEPLLLQPINQLFIAGVEKPENEIQRSEEFDIYKTPNPDNEVEQRDSIEIVGAEKTIDQTINRSINSICLEKQGNEVQRTEEFYIYKNPRPENVVKRRDAIEIVNAEKEPLQLQQINLYLST